MKFKERLLLPEIKNDIDLSDLEITLLHKKILQKKKFLKSLYKDFYDEFNKNIMEINKTKRKIVEIGSGGGFLKEVIHDVVTSDILELPGIDMKFSATEMPFDDYSIDAFLMFNVLHHINNSKKFFSEIQRCLSSNGKLIMIEPANTIWSRFIYTKFHNEPFDINSGWIFDSSGPLSSANGALPWIIFFRDRIIFEEDFPLLKIKKIRPHTPFRYLISGGFTIKELLPFFMYKPIKFFEILLSPLNKFIAMYQTIEVVKKCKY